MSELDDAVEAVMTLDKAVNQDLEPVEVDSALVVVTGDYQSPWDRFENETDYAWDMFTHFRDSGLQRSQKATIEYGRQNYDWKSSGAGGEASHGDQIKISKLSTKNDWNRRVFAFDQDQERLYQLARSEAIREMAIRHENAIQDAIGGLMTPIEALKLAMENDPAFIENLSQKNSTKLIDLANRASRTIPTLMAAERVSRGMPTEIVGGVIEHEVVHSVDRNQIGDILDVLERAGKLDGRGPGLGVGEIIDAEVVEVHSVPADGDG